MMADSAGSALTAVEMTGLLEERPLRGARRVVARRLGEAHRNCVPVTLHRDLDVTPLVRAGLSPGAVLDRMLHATVLTLQAHPELNGTFDGEVHRTYRSVHLGNAADTPRGLLVPVLRDAQALDATQLSEARRVQAQRARAWKHTPDELAGGTLTVTNLGPLSIDFFTPIVNPPQVGILGLGRIRQATMSWTTEEAPANRSLLPASLTFDHRICDGANAARFLETLQREILTMST